MLKRIVIDRYGNAVEKVNYPVDPPVAMAAMPTAMAMSAEPVQQPATQQIVFDQPQPKQYNPFGRATADTKYGGCGTCGKNVSYG